MTKTKWLTAEDLQRLRACDAPIPYIRALGDLAHPPVSAKHFDYSERYGVFIDMTQQRRSLKGAQSAAFKVAETLDLRLSGRRSVWDFHGSKAVCFQWTCVPGWNLSVSAEFYSGDHDWCEVALLIHRRFADAQSRQAMDEHVKSALWGPDPGNWPGRLYDWPAVLRTEAASFEHPGAALFADLLVDVKSGTTAAHASLVAAEPSPNPGVVTPARGSLADLFTDE